MGNKKKPDEDMKYLTPDDWKLLKAVIDDPEFLLYFDTVQTLGLRAEEGLALTPRKFNFLRQEVRIATLKRDGHPVFILDVRPDLSDKLKRRAGTMDPDQQFFPFPYHRVWRRFKKYVKMAGLNPRLSPHALRHLCGLRLAQATGGNMVEIAKGLRHADPSTSAHYVHVSPARRREVAKRMWEDQEETGPKDKTTLDSKG